jgi:hypothetical protein
VVIGIRSAAASLLGRAFRGLRSLVMRGDETNQSFYGVWAASPRLDMQAVMLRPGVAPAPTLSPTC